jgi:hypothetical protein
MWVGNAPNQLTSADGRQLGSRDQSTVFADRAPFVRTIDAAPVANTLSIGGRSDRAQCNSLTICSSKIRLRSVRSSVGDGK